MFQKLRPNFGRALFIVIVGLFFLSACNTDEATPEAEPTDVLTAVNEEEATEPTAEPTDEPTTEPVAEPIEEPTEESTEAPTEEPTAEPTEEPATEPEENDEVETETAVAEIGAFVEADCEFDVPEGRDVTCGWLTVPEDRNNPDDGQTVRLHVAKFASESDNPAPDPIVYLEGGPGGEPLEAVPFTFEILFAPYLANHDFIIFDQRGTGYSEPSLACPELRELSFELFEQTDLTPDETTELTIGSLVECRDRLEAEGVNLAAYNSAANAADLNDLRIALGYDEWNILGISYGTRLAQTTMRDHPAGIRSVILDSTYPLAANLLTDTSDNIIRAYGELFDGCAQDTACNEAYPNLEETFFNVVAKYNAEPADITVADLFTGETYDTILHGDDLTGLLFQTLYSTEIIPSLPQLIYELDEGNTTTLAALISSFLLNGEFMSIGMQFSVQCNEENSFTDPAEAVAAAEKYPELEPFMSNSVNLGPRALDICEFWGAGTADAIENEAISSDIPTLVLAGEYDPITPPAWGVQVAEQLSNSSYYEFPGTGHGVSISGECAVEVVQSFLADPSAEPDTTCLAEVTGPEFAGTGEAEAVTLVPYENSTFGTTGVVPEGWEEAAPGVYARGASALDQTVIIQQATPGMSADDLLDLLSGQLGWSEVPESSGRYETDSGSWTLYETAVQDFPAFVGVNEVDGATMLVLLISPVEEQEVMYSQVFLPVLEAMTIQ